MAVIETPQSRHFPWYVRLFFWSQKRRYGAVLEPARLWGRTPKVFVTLALLYGALDRSTSLTESALRTLITVRVSQINHCAFCVDVNASTALKRGISEEKLMSVAGFATITRFTPREQAALAYAEAMTRTGQRATGNACAFRCAAPAFQRRRGHRIDRVDCVPESVKQIQRRPASAAAGLLPGDANARATQSGVVTE